MQISMAARCCGPRGGSSFRQSAPSRTARSAAAFDYRQGEIIAANTERVRAGRELESISAARCWLRWKRLAIRGKPTAIPPPWISCRPSLRAYRALVYETLAFELLQANDPLQEISNSR